MKPRTTLALVLAALVALGVVYFWEKGLPGTDERRERRGRLLPHVELDGVRAVVVERAGERLSLVRSGDEWWLREPVEDRADRYRIEQLVRGIIEARVTGRIAAERVQGGDEATGLGEGAVRVELESDGATATVELGAISVPGGLRYARLGDAEPLALVRDRVAEDLAVSIDELRDRSLLDATTIDMRRLVVEKGGERILELVRGGAEERGEAWWIVHPLEDEADRGRVTTLLSEVIALRAESFIDASPAATSDGGSPGWRVVAELAASGDTDGAGEEESSARVVELRLDGETANGAALRTATISGREAMFEVSAGKLLAELERPAEEFRSLLALDVTTWDVAEVEIVRGGESVTVARVEDEFDPESKWQPVAPADFPLDAAAFDRTLSELARIEARRLVDGVSARDAGLDEPVAALTIRYEDEPARPPVTLEIGGPAGSGAVFARRTGRPTVFVVDEEIAAKIESSRIRRDEP